MSESAVSNERLQRFCHLQQTFSAQLPERLQAISALWTSGKPSAPSMDSELFRSVHSLAGSAGSFGFHVLGSEAQRLEALFAQGDTSLGSVGWAQAVCDSVARLQRLGALAPQPMEAYEPLGPMDAATTCSDAPVREVLLLEDDAVLAQEIRRQMANFGFDVSTAQSLEEAREAVTRRDWAALVIDMHLQEGRLQGADFVKSLLTLPRNALPVIFISMDVAWEARLAAVRAGGRAYLTKPLEFTLLADWLERLTGNRVAEPLRILVVDDDPLLAERLELALTHAGMVVQVLQEPIALLDVIPEFHPDLVLMDLYIPGCSGVEAARVIRQTPALVHLPIVFLSSESALTQQLKAMRVGGDDFLHKSLPDDALVSAIETRALRFRELRDLAGRDSLTGLLNHIALKLALESELEHAQRRAASTAFVMIDIDHFKQVNDQHGHPVGDGVIRSLARLLHQRLRKADLVGRYGGEEFAVVLRDTAPKEAVQLIDALRARFAAIVHVHGAQRFSVTFSAGIAVSDGKQPVHVDALVQTADQALYRAKGGGRNRVELGHLEPSFGTNRIPRNSGC